MTKKNENVEKAQGAETTKIEKSAAEIAKESAQKLRDQAKEATKKAQELREKERAQAKKERDAKKEAQEKERAEKVKKEKEQKELAEKAIAKAQKSFDEIDTQYQELKEQWKKAKSDLSEAQKLMPRKRGGGGRKNGPGVISTICDFISESDGVTKDQIIEHLVSVFPDRSPDSLKGTVNAQVPTRISKEKFPVERDSEGLYRKVG